MADRCFSLSSSARRFKRKKIILRFRTLEGLSFFFLPPVACRFIMNSPAFPTGSQEVSKVESRLPDCTVVRGPPSSISLLFGGDKAGIGRFLTV